MRKILVLGFVTASAISALAQTQGPLNASSVTTPTLNSLPTTEYKTTSNNPAQLGRWWSYLHGASNYAGSALTAGMDVIFPNDSLWSGDWTNATGCGGNTAVPQYSQNRQAEQIRIALQAQYGYGGTGLMPLINAAACTSLINPELYSAVPSGIATSGIIGPQWSNQYSLVQMASGQVITWNAGGLPYSFVRTYCADNASSHAITVAIDSVGVGSACGTTNASPIARVAVSSSAATGSTTHTATFTCTTGPCFMYGAEGRIPVNSGNSGVRVHNVSVGSAPAEWFAGHTEFEDLISDGYGTTGSAQLVIYAMGTNEPGLGISLATYQASVTSYLGHELAKTTCPGVLTFSCSPTVVIYRPGMNSINSASYFTWLTGTYAPANNLLVIDQTNRWGKTYIASNWMMGNDGIHFNDIGTLDAAHTILSALMDHPKSTPVSPVFGDNFLNSGQVGVTAPNGTIAPGYTWFNVAGIPSNKGIFGWQTGNGNGLPGTIGLYDPLNYSGGLVWMTDAANDFCVHVPFGTAAFNTCALYADFAVNTSTHRTTVKEIANSQTATLTALAAAGTGATVTCAAGFECTPNSFVVTEVVGTGPTVGDQFKLTWGSAWAYKPNCLVSAYDNTASTYLTTWSGDLGAATLTTANVQVFTTAPIAAHNITVWGHCFN